MKIYRRLRVAHIPPEEHWREYNDSLRRQQPLLWYLTLLGPLLLSLAILLTLYFIHGWPYVRGLLLSALAVFFFFGRFVILGGVSGNGGGGGSGELAGELEAATRFFSPGELALLVLYMDTMVASLLVFHIGFLFSLPFLGDRLRLLMDDGRFILQAHPWMKRLTFVGIVTFVTFPLAATGSVGGSIFGRLLGMSRLATFLGVVLGSMLGCGTMYFGASLLNRLIDRDDPWLTVAGIIFVAALVLLLNLRYRKLKTQWQAAGQKTPR